MNIHAQPFVPRSMKFDSDVPSTNSLSGHFSEESHKHLPVSPFRVNVSPTLLEEQKNTSVGVVSVNPTPPLPFLPTFTSVPPTRVPSVVRDTLPIPLPMCTVYSHYIASSVVYLMLRPYKTHFVSRYSYNPLTSEQTSPLELHPLGQKCLCTSICAIDSYSEESQVFQPPPFSTWKPSTIEELTVYHEIFRISKLIFTRMSTKMKITESEILQSFILLERVLTSDISQIPFVLNQKNVSMAMIASLLLVNKAISTDTPFANKFWCVCFGINQTNLHISELFLLKKVGWDVFLSDKEWNSVRILKELITKVYPSTDAIKGLSIKQLELQMQLPPQSQSQCQVQSVSHQPEEQKIQQSDIYTPPYSSPAPFLPPSQHSYSQSSPCTSRSAPLLVPLPLPLPLPPATPSLSQSL